MLNSRKISIETYTKMSERLNRLSERIEALREALEEERSLQKSLLEEERRILETLLVEFNYRRLIGEISENEWSEISQILSLGIDSIGKLTVKEIKKPTPPIFFMPEIREEKNISSLQKTGADDPAKFKGQIKASGKSDSNRKRQRGKKRSSVRMRGRAIKKPSLPVKESTSPIHCMNPWKKDCRNTDIELSIYYNGELLPICSECWREICEKNIEW